LTLHLMVQGFAKADVMRVSLAQRKSRAQPRPLASRFSLAEIPLILGRLY
jgi:hypothetical protein